jgi:hypothetical protein
LSCAHDVALPENFSYSKFSVVGGITHLKVSGNQVGWWDLWRRLADARDADYRGRLVTIRFGD